MSSRPLHAVLLPPEPGGGRLLAALSAALDGTGPAILPLDPGLPPGRLQQILAAFRPAAVETPDGTRRLGPPAAAGTVPAGTVPASTVPAGVADDVAVVVATSGSTGQPKGVQLSADALRASARSSIARIGARPGQRWLCCLPGFHVAGLQVLIRSLLAGIDPVVTSGIDAGVISEAGCAYVSVVPTQLRRLVDSGAPLDSFDTILLGGAAPGGTLLADARAAGGRVVVTYGMSETSGGCVYDGWPLDGVRLRIGPGGLIGIAGPVLFSGYRAAGRAAGRPPGEGAPGARPLAPGEEAAGEGAAGEGAAPDGGWFWTSDLGSLDAAGRLTVRGRADDVINTGGEKVVPGEVEAVLGTIPGVRDVVVVGMPDSEWGEVVTAVVVAEDPAAPPDLSQLRGHARDRLPGYAAPRRMLLASRIPLLPSGKPDRIALQATARENPGS